jgi:lipopolysaccharide biosynthesis regulator YciM
MATSGDQTMEPKSVAEATVNPEQDNQPTPLTEIQIKILHLTEVSKQLTETLAVANDQCQNVQELQQQIDQLTKEKDLLVNENDRLVSGYRKLEEENSQLKEQLATVNEQSNTPETQKLIDHLTLENGPLREAREVVIEQLKAQPIMQDMINKLVKEKTKLEEELSTSRNTLTVPPKWRSRLNNLGNRRKMW